MSDEVYKNLNHKQSQITRASRKHTMVQAAGQNPFARVEKDLVVDDKTYKMYKLGSLEDARYEKLPFSIRVLLESAVRNCDDFNVKRK